MPQTSSAKKALRSSARKRTVNNRWRTALRTGIRAVKDAIKAKDKNTAYTAFEKAQSVIDRAARRHIIHTNNAARKKSRLKQAIEKIQAE